MPYDLICNFTDNLFNAYSIKKKKYYSLKINKFMQELRINNSEQYFQEIEEFIKKNHLMENIINNRIIIIIPSFYSETDKSILTNIFERIGFNKIKLIKTVDVISLKKNCSSIEINENNLIYYYNYKEKIKHIHILLEQFTTDRLNKTAFFISEFNKHFKVSKSYFWGSNKNLIKISNIAEEISQIGCYIYQNNSYYLIESYLKKYGK